MKVTLEFSVPDDQAPLDAALVGTELALALSEIRRHLRDRRKHGNHSKKTRAELDALWELVPHELLERVWR